MEDGKPTRRTVLGTLGIAVLGLGTGSGAAQQENNAVRGRIEGSGADDYDFTGGIVEFSISEGEAMVTVNGEEVEDPIGLPEEETDETSTIEIDAVSEVVEYRIVVSGVIEFGSTAGDFDELTSEPVDGDENGDDTDASQFVVRQDGECYPVTPISGDVPAREFYDWRYADPENPYVVNWGTSFSSEGTVDLQRENTSHLLLYDGPDGLSLVLIHGKFVPDGERDQLENLQGGSATFTVTELPEDGEWVVLDDRYQGQRNFDEFDISDTEATIDWTWAAGRTDGGVFRGLTDEDPVEIDPEFNESAALFGEFYDGIVERWELLSGDRDDPERTELALDEPIIIEAGDC